jgi:hypothetical protein
MRIRASPLKWTRLAESTAVSVIPMGGPSCAPKLRSTAKAHSYTWDADPGGHFLAEDVVAGSYSLRATGAAWNPKAEGEIWAPTYFPSTIDREAAEPFPFTNGLTVAREVRLCSVPARRVCGVVRDETGEMSAGVSVLLENKTAVTAADGIFEFVTRDGK